MRQLVLLALLVVPSIFAGCSQQSTCKKCISSGCSWCTTTQNCVAQNGLECIFGTRISDVEYCPFEIPEQYAYNEEFARNIMLPLSGVAYYGDPRQCLTNALNGGSLVRQISLKCDASGDDVCSGFTAISTHHKAIILSFRGSVGFVQLVMEGAESVFLKKVSLPGGGKVSKYFYDAFNVVWSNGMMEDLLSARQQHPDYEIWITGHSLGGSMASIAANVIVASKICPGDQIKLVTFGQPRTGDEQFSKLHDETLPYTYRVTHRLDLVPHLPTEGYADYYHHRYEVWYNNDMKKGDKYKLCLSPEDGECSDSNLIDYSVEDHLHYFGKDVVGLGENGCL